MTEAIYIDSSALLKLLWKEPESNPVRLAVAAEDLVVISELAELETEVQLRARWLSGDFTRPVYGSYRSKLSSFRELSPFEFREVPGTVFSTAVKQHLSARHHCRTLDRLHLAAMQELQVRRLMTNDLKQAAAGLALGYEVLSPGSRR